MRVEREMASAQIQDDMVSSERFRSDGNGARCQPRYIFRNAVFRKGNDAVLDCKYFAAVGRMGFVLLFVAIECPAVRTNLHPVDREPLRQVNCAIQWNQRAAMNGTVCGPVCRNPIRAAQRRTNRDGFC